MQQSSEWSNLPQFQHEFLASEGVPNRFRFQALFLWEIPGVTHVETAVVLSYSFQQNTYFSHDLRLEQVMLSIYDSAVAT